MCFLVKLTRDLTAASPSKNKPTLEEARTILYSNYLSNLIKPQRCLCNYFTLTSKALSSPFHIVRLLAKY